MTASDERERLITGLGRGGDRFSVPSVAPAATPVRLRRDLVLAKAPAGQDLPQGRDHRRLAEHVRVPVTVAELDLRGFSAEQCGVTWRPAEPVQPAQPGLGRGEEFLLVVGL